MHMCSAIFRPNFEDLDFIGYEDCEFIVDDCDLDCEFIVYDCDLDNNLYSDNQPRPSIAESSFSTVLDSYVHYVSEIDKIKGQLAYSRVNGRFFNIYSSQFPLHLQLSQGEAENIHDCVKNGDNYKHYGFGSNFVNENGVTFNKVLLKQMPSTPVPEVAHADRNFDIHLVFASDQLIADIHSRSLK